MLKIQLHNPADALKLKIMGKMDDVGLTWNSFAKMPKIKVGSINSILSQSFALPAVVMSLEFISLQNLSNKMNDEKNCVIFNLGGEGVCFAFMLIDWTTADCAPCYCCPYPFAFCDSLIVEFVGSFYRERGKASNNIVYLACCTCLTEIQSKNCLLN